MPDKPFVFIYGDDDFIVNRDAAERFAKWGEVVTDEFSREVVDGMAARVGDVAEIVGQFVAATQTISLFGDSKIVWLRGINFLADSVLGRSEQTIKQLQRLSDALEQNDPSAVKVLLSASPVDRRRREFKRLAKQGETTDWKGGSDPATLAPLVKAEAEAQQVQFAPGCIEVLLGKINGNSRLAMEEVRKLATWLGPQGGTITEDMVIELVPNYGEGDFFEPVEAFFALDISWTLDALKRYFFNNVESRPLLTMLQNRTRLLIQVKALLDGGRLKMGPRGFSAADLQRASSGLIDSYGAVASEKSGFNVFSQNPWYLANKVAPAARSVSLKRLLEWQEAFLDGFGQLLDRPLEQHAIMRDLAARCLSPN